MKSSMNSILSVKNLSINFKNFKAISSVNWEENSNGIVGLIGPNGSGKTTLIRAILNFNPHYSGEITLGVSNSEIAFCPDKPEFEPWLTPNEILEQSIKLVKSSDRVDELMDTRSKILTEVNLIKFADKKVGGFSRGMQQRLGLASVLILKPKLLFLDEPTSALDPLGTDLVEKLIKSYSKECLVIYSTHNLNQLQNITDRVLFLENGQKIYYGELDDFLKTYSSDQSVLIKIDKKNQNLVESLKVLNPQVIESKLNSISLLISNKFLSQMFVILSQYPEDLLQINSSNTSLAKAFLSANESSKNEK